MLYSIKHSIYGDRTVFGYTHTGAGESVGACSVKEAIDMIDEEYKEYEWTNSRWNGDDLILDFEKKEQANQIVETVELQPEVYSEFIVLKKWEKTHEHLQG